MTMNTMTRSRLTAHARAKWLADLLGDDFFHEVIRASLFGDVQMDCLPRLPRLQELHLFGESVTDAGMEKVKELKRLRLVLSSVAKISGNGLMCLRGFGSHASLCHVAGESGRQEDRRALCWPIWVFPAPSNEPFVARGYGRHARETGTPAQLAGSILASPTESLRARA